MPKTLRLISTTLILSLTTFAYADNATEPNRGARLAIEKQYQAQELLKPASFSRKPIFRHIVRGVDFPPCHCDDKGNPLKDCQIQTIKVETTMKVNKRGVPRRIKIVSGSGYPRLDRNIINKLNIARFHPVQKNGQPVAGIVSIPFNLQYKPAMEAVCYSRREQQLLSEQPIDDVMLPTANNP